jgi:ubiquinone/menaquinone biosynthesis C-methylase UbiE
MTTAIQPYRKLSTIYDRMGADQHSLKMTEYCRQIFRRFKIHPESGLDLCCGTGTALKVFADWGISMSGLDRSTPMLALAARKLSGRGIRLYQKSLPCRPQGEELTLT